MRHRTPPPDSREPIAETESYSLRLPSAWLAIPCDEAGLRSFAAEAEALPAGDGWSPARRRRLRFELRRLDRTLGNPQVRAAAVFAEVWGDGEPTGDHGPGGMVSATLVLTVQPATDLGGPPRLGPQALRLALSGNPPVPPHPGGSRGVALEPPALVALPAGPAVRHRVRHTWPGPLGRREGVYTESFLIPHDDGRKVAVLCFAAANEELARPLSGLFAAIARTFELHGSAAAGGGDGWGGDAA